MRLLLHFIDCNVWEHGCFVIAIFYDANATDIKTILKYLGVVYPLHC